MDSKMFSFYDNKTKGNGAARRRQNQNKSAEPCRAAPSPIFKVKKKMLPIGFIDPGSIFWIFQHWCIVVVQVLQAKNIILRRF